jgi:hypothetical protein
MNPELALAIALLAALAAALQWQRARRTQRNLEIWKKALHSAGFEASNAVNAIRVNLLAFRQVNPMVVMPEHLDEIETGARRIAAIHEIVQDPVAWHRRRKQKPAAPGVSVC